MKTKTRRVVIKVTQETLLSLNIVSIEPFQFNANHRPWTDAEWNYLQKTNDRLTRKEQALHLDRTLQAVSAKVQVLGLQKTDRTKSDTPSRGKKIKKQSQVQPWTNPELAVLHRFSQLSLEEMSQLLQRPYPEILRKLRQIYPVPIRRALFYEKLAVEVSTLTLDGVDASVLQQIKDRVLSIGRDWCQHPKAVCMRLIGFRLMIKGIITEGYNQVTGTDDIPFSTEKEAIYQRRYRLQEHLYGGMNK